MWSTSEVWSACGCFREAVSIIRGVRPQNASLCSLFVLEAAGAARLSAYWWNSWILRFVSVSQLATEAIDIAVEVLWKLFVAQPCLFKAAMEGLVFNKLVVVR